MTHTLTRTYTVSADAEQFNPDVHPWPRGVVQNNFDGVMIANSYFLVAGYRIMPIHPGDWVTYDQEGRPDGTLNSTFVENHWTARRKRYTTPRS
jgi:hypothetical protein